MKNNNFTENTSIIHSSHGGAVSIECDFLNEQVEVSRGATYPRRLTSEIDYSLINSYNFQSQMLDSVSNMLYEYARDVKLESIVLKENLFTGNGVGQKGTAIYTRQVTNLVITGNELKEN